MRPPNGNVLFTEIRLLAIRGELNVSGAEAFQNPLCRCLQVDCLLQDFRNRLILLAGSRTHLFLFLPHVVDPILYKSARSAVRLFFTRRGQMSS